MIYEGTNEIQAIDLLLRKIAADSGEQLDLMLDELAHGLTQTNPLRATVLDLFQKIKSLTHQLMHNKERAQFQHQLSLIASDYLRLLFLALIAWSWSQIEHELSLREDASELDDFSQQLLQSSKTFQTFILPQTQVLLSVIENVGLA